MIIAETQHVVRYGPRVPQGCVNLAYLDFPALTPDSCLTILPAWQDIDGNTETASTRQIRVDGVFVTPRQEWQLLLRPGSFYRSQSVAAYRAQGAGLGVDDTALDADGTLQFCYNLGTAASTPSLRTAVSDPVLSVSGVPVTRISATSSRLPYTPLDVDTTVTLTGLRDGVTLSTVTATIVDAEQGLIQTTPLDASLEWVAAYAGTVSGYPYAGYLDDGVWYTLDLNPLPGHWCGAIPSAEYTTVQSDGLDVQDLRGRTVIVDDVTYAPAEWFPSQELLGKGGIQVWLWPTTVDYIAPDGTRSNFWQLTDTRRDVVQWYPNDIPVYPATIPQLLAVILPRQMIASSQVNIYDTRTPGGGVDGLSATQAAQLGYFDVTSLDGQLFPTHGVLVVRAPQALVDRYGRAGVLERVQRHVAAGVVCVLEVV